MDKSDRDLWIAYIGCSQKALYSLFIRYYRQFYLMAYGILKNEMEIEDVIGKKQLFFLSKRKEDKQKLSRPDSVKAYLMRSIRNDSIAVKRKNSRMGSLEDVDPEDQMFELVNGILWATPKFLDCVLEHISNMTRLSPLQKKVWILSAKGDSPKEIGKELGISPGTARVHKSNALKAVKRKREEITAWLELKSREECKKVNE